MIWIILSLAVLALAASGRGRRGCRVNDLSRWEPFGGKLKRPPPPAPMRRSAR